MPEHQPEACRSGEPGMAPLVSYFDRDLRFPQDFKIAAGIDRRLPGGLVATADFLYSRATQQPYFVDVNLLSPIIQPRENHWAFGRSLKSARADQLPAVLVFRRNRTMLVSLRLSGLTGFMTLGVAGRRSSNFH